MRKTVLYVVISFCLFLVGGRLSFAAESEQVSRQNAIPFEENQWYAIAHLGYQQMDDLDYYVEQYLDSDKLPIHYISNGDFYLVIPRYSGMQLSLSVNDMETQESHLRYEDPDCRPFIMQCNVSDIFPDVTVCLSYKGETIEFSPFLSLENGALDAGEYGLDITKEGTEISIYE